MAELPFKIGDVVHLVNLGLDVTIESEFDLKEAETHRYDHNGNEIVKLVKRPADGE